MGGGGGWARLRQSYHRMQPARNGLARPLCNGAIPSSDSGMCSCARLYLLHPAMLHSRVGGP